MKTWLDYWKRGWIINNETHVNQNVVGLLTKSVGDVPLYLNLDNSSDTWCMRVFRELQYPHKILMCSHQKLKPTSNVSEPLEKFYGYEGVGVCIS